MSITIKDIAKAANVSYATVSRALNDHPEINNDTKERIKCLAEEMGYTPNAIAKGLVRNSSQTIGLIIPDITNPFFPEVAQGIEDSASKHGFQVFLCNTNWEVERERMYLKALYGKRVDGIVVAPACDETGYIMDLVGKHVPVVFAAYRPAVENCNYVVTDDYKSATIAAEYLVKLGHRKIAYIGGKQESNTSIIRHRGYADVLKKHNIPYNHSYVKHGTFKQESGYSLTKELLLENDIPTAVLVGNDIAALGAIQAIEEFGLKVPDNISVMGFDNISFAALDKIQLTTIHQSKYEIGEKCFEILLDRIENPNDKSFVSRVLEPSLIIRKTCKGV